MVLLVSLVGYRLGAECSEEARKTRAARAVPAVDINLNSDGGVPIATKVSISYQHIVKCDIVGILPTFSGIWLGDLK